MAMSWSFAGRQRLAWVVDLCSGAGTGFVEARVIGSMAAGAAAAMGGVATAA